ncbi:MAG: hypothetical protein VX733_13945 [Candidatus Latescibacterota bacterium]|nr:hypothetical protein [Candidatus Latescibacterota bacterium]
MAEPPSFAALFILDQEAVQVERSSEGKIVGLTHLSEMGGVVDILSMSVSSETVPRFVPRRMME